MLLHELAGATLEPSLFVQAARLADHARQQEVTAIALAERDVIRADSGVGEQPCVLVAGI